MLCDGGGLRCIFRLLSSSHCLPLSLVPPPARAPSPWLGSKPAPPFQKEKAPEGGRWTGSEINTIWTAVFYISEHTQNARIHPMEVGCKHVNRACKAAKSPRGPVGSPGPSLTHPQPGPSVATFAVKPPCPGRAGLLGMHGEAGIISGEFHNLFPSFFLCTVVTVTII